jgi:CCR4-NOT transcription complex subunit 1
MTTAEQLREKLFIWFQQLEWVAIFQRSYSPEKTFVPFITEPTKQGLLKIEDVSSVFFHVCRVERQHLSQMCCRWRLRWRVSTLGSEFSPHRILVYHGDISGINNDQAKVHYMMKILSIFVLVLNLLEEQSSHFSDFFFFSSLNDLHTVEAGLTSVYLAL